MKSSEVNITIEVGNKVIFDENKIDVFKKETNGEDKAIKDYQKLVLAGIDQVGVVKELKGNLTIVS